MGRVVGPGEEIDTEVRVSKPAAIACSPVTHHLFPCRHYNWLILSYPLISKHLYFSNSQDDNRPQVQSSSRLPLAADDRDFHRIAMHPLYPFAGTNTSRGFLFARRRHPNYWSSPWAVRLVSCGLLGLPMEPRCIPPIYRRISP